MKQKYFCIGGKRRNFNVNLNRIMPYSAVALVGLFGLILFPVSFVIDSTEAAPVLSTTSLTLSTSDISAEITPSSAAGTFVASDPATVSVTTNNYSGYTLGITSSDNVNNTKLINTDDNTAYLTSISSASAPADFNANNWGYLPSKLNGAANSAYQPAPTTTATTLEATNAANAEANTYTIALGVKADYTLPTGIYENTFAVTAVANPVSYAITYDKNTTDTVTNMPANLVGDTATTSVTLSNLVPQREEYDFIGWNTAANGSGTTYNPNGGGTDLVYDLDQTTANADILYAQWKSNKIYIQDITTATCPTTATKVYDNRDETSYHIKKLADGRCWMLDNLALDLTNSTVKNNLTASNTNASATSLNYLKNGGGTTSDKYATAGVANWTSSYSFSAPLVNMDSKNVVPDNAPTNGQGDNKVGGYYNYCAASAGSYCYGNGTYYGNPSGNATEDICPAGWRMSIGNTTGEYSALANVIYGSTGSTSDATAVANYRNALSLPLSGSFNNGSANGQGSTSHFWSSTKRDDHNMYLMSVSISSSSTSLNPSTSTLSYYGTPVRCIAKAQDMTITFNANGGTGSMPNQALEPGIGILNPNTFARSGYAFLGWNTAANGSGTSYANGAIYTGSSTTLYAQWGVSIQSKTTSSCPTTATVVYDERDSTPYHIQKLADGRCWMLDNLALDLLNPTVLNNTTASNTNASATTLNYLKNGGGSTSDKYATAGVAELKERSYSVPLVNMNSKDTIPSNAPANGKGYNKVGGYYNYCAASAGSYCYGNGNSEGTPSGNATEDICPKNWRMPTGSASGEYVALAKNYGTISSTGSTENATTITNYRNALSLPLSGSCSSQYSDSQGSIGYFWSSTRYTNYNTDMYALYVYKTSNFYGGNHNYRSTGYSVRCVAN